MTRAASEDSPSIGSAIAVIGMAGRFAGATDVEAFWRNLRDGVESIERYSDEELLAFMDQSAVDALVAALAK